MPPAHRATVLLASCDAKVAGVTREQDVNARSRDAMVVEVGMRALALGLLCGQTRE